MRKHLKTALTVSALPILLLLLHFIPVDSRSGYIHDEWCLGDSAPPAITHSYRWVTGGVNQWDDEVSGIQPSNSECKTDQPEHLRLYIF